MESSDIQAVNEQIAALIKDILIRETACAYDEDKNFFSCEIYADYRDCAENDTVIKWCQSDNPRDAFYEDIAEWFQESIWQCEDDAIKTVRDNWVSEEFPYNEHQELIEEWIKEHLCVEPPCDHYLKQEVCVDIIVDTGDENYDYVSNDMYPHYNASSNDVIAEGASILWLIRQQGYKKHQLNKALRYEDYSGSKLLKSIRTEVANCSTHMNALTFFVEMTVEQLFDLHEAIKENGKNDPPLEKDAYRCVWERKGRKKIVIDKDAVCGLYDTWNGAGSVLEIDLEKDVVLPLKYVSSALPDGGRGWSVANVYGVCSSMWTPTLKKIA